MKTTPLPLEALPDADLREEWEHFRGFGWSDKRIATRLGIHWDTVSKWVYLYEQRGRAVRPSASKRRARVAALIKEGLSHKEVADVLGVSRHTVHDDCCRLGLTRRTNSLGSIGSSDAAGGGRLIVGLTHAIDRLREPVLP